MSKYNIQRYTKTITVEDGETVGTALAEDLNGLIVGILIDVPDLTGTTTITLALTDVDGYSLFSKSSIAENQKTVNLVDGNNHPLRIPVSGQLNFTATQTNAQSGSESQIEVVLLVDRGR